MKLLPAKPGRRYRYFWILIAMVTATAPTALAVAQGGAIQAVRQRVSGLEGPGAPPSDGRPGGPGQPMTPGANGAKVDLTLVPANIATLSIARPAQLFTSPMTQMLPTEIASAASKMSLGMDPADIDEVVQFVDLSNPGMPETGTVFKFNKPFRAANLPPNLVTGTKLSEFNGKKYLEAAAPGRMSFYGTDNKTLIMASDALLKKVVQGAAQPKSGGILDRVRDMPAGNDFLAVVDVAALRAHPMVQAMLPMLLAQAKAPPEAKQIIDSLSLIEIQANLVSRGPVSLLLHFNDDPGAQQFATQIEAKKADVAAKLFGEIPQPGDPISQARGQWRDRMMQKYWPQLNGSDVKFHIDADDPLQPQLLGVAMGAGAYAKFAHAYDAMKKTGAPAGGPTASAGGAPEGPGGPGGAPAATPAQ